MRLIVMLIALLIVGFLIYKQMGSGSVQPPKEAQAIAGSNAPKVPTNPNELNQFGTQMNEYMNKVAEDRAAAIEKAESQ